MFTLRQKSATPFCNLYGKSYEFLRISSYLNKNQGNTVNVASRMDSTGENWKIQVPDYTAELLMNRNYTCIVCPHVKHERLRMRIKQTLHPSENIC